MSTKLRQEVWALQRCSGCGACVAACSKGMLYWDHDQHPNVEERQKSLGLSRLTLRACEVCQKFCEESCPRLVEPTPIAALTMASARSAGVAVRPGGRRPNGVEGGSPNQVIQALLVAARSTDLIDGAILPDLDPWTLQPVVRVATTVEEMVSGVGMQYLWAPVLSALNEAIFQRGLTKLAIVGTPCVAEGARRLLNSDNERLWPYKQAIRLTVAQFCTGIYMPGLVSDLLERGLGLARQQIKGLTTRVQEGELVVTLWDGAQRVIPLTEVEPFTRQGCGSCSDYLGESADIAVGALGALPDHATLITRTPVGEVALQNARQLGLLETVAEVDALALDAAKKQKDRRTRAQAFDNLGILMLDALGDLKKRDQVRQQFASLYGAGPAAIGTPSREDGTPTAPKEDCHVHCSGC